MKEKPKPNIQTSRTDGTEKPTLKIQLLPWKTKPYPEKPNLKSSYYPEKPKNQTKIKPCIEKPTLNLKAYLRNRTDYPYPKKDLVFDRILD